MGGTTTTGLPYPTGSDMVRDGDNAIRSLAEAVDTRFADTGWINVVFQNAWAQYAGWETCQYRRRYGLVHTRGLAVGGNSGTAVFTYPVGFRPNPLVNGAHIPIAQQGVFGIMNLFGDGRWHLNAGTNGGWVSLWIPPFIAEQ